MCSTITEVGGRPSPRKTCSPFAIPGQYDAARRTVPIAWPLMPVSAVMFMLSAKVRRRPVNGLLGIGGSATVAPRVDAPSPESVAVSQCDGLGA